MPSGRRRRRAARTGAVTKVAGFPLSSPRGLRVESRMVSQMADEDEEATGEEQVANSPRERILELTVTILLAFSALLSAWCAYQASRFGGDQSLSYTKAQSFQVEAARAENRAGQLTQIDIGVFQSWVDAQAAGNQRLADFYRARFRAEFTPAFDAWLAADPLNSATAPKTPFELTEYHLSAQDAAAAATQRAEDSFRAGNEQGDTSDHYVLTVVLFASALFMLGIQSRIGIFELRAALVGTAAVIILLTTVWVLTLQVSWPW
jgi:hypothetical protein